MMSLRAADARASDNELTREDIAKITAVCRSLLWSRRLAPERDLREQTHALHSVGKALEQSRQVECSFHCGGTLLLRGDSDTWYGFSNQPINVTHRIDTVAFHIHGKRVVAVGPGIDYYPYPYYDTETKKR